MLISLFLFLIAFVLLWIGSGLAVSAITKIAHSLRMSSFFISFFVLGLFTSLTEIMVGINAVIQNQPEVFVGNLIGGSTVIFLLIIPLLAIIGNGVNLNHSLRFKDLVSAVIAIGIPALLTLDNQITIIDAIICILIYCYFVFMQERSSGYLERLVIIDLGRSTIYQSIGKTLIAVALVFLASHILVNQIPVVGTALGISPFVISALIIFIGTNIPEMSIAVRALVSGKKDIALGNYLGSATLNTLEFGILSLIGRKSIAAEGSNFSVLAMILGLTLFLYFGKSRSNLSRFEGFGLLACYLLFVVFELTTGPGWNF